MHNPGGRHVLYVPGFIWAIVNPRRWTTIRGTWFVVVVESDSLSSDIGRVDQVSDNVGLVVYEP